MNWDKLDLHLENLIPGLAIVSLALFYFPPDLTALRDQTVLLGVAYIALSYLAGAVGNILARLLLDPVSAHTFRAPLIRLFAKQKIADLKRPLTRAIINARYSELIDSAMVCGNEAIVNELLKRRQTARLCRSALVPLLLVVLHSYMSTEWWWLLLTLAATYCFMLALYSYSEVAIFTEAHRGFRILQRATNAINQI